VPKRGREQPLFYRDFLTFFTFSCDFSCCLLFLPSKGAVFCFERFGLMSRLNHRIFPVGGLSAPASLFFVSLFWDYWLLIFEQTNPNPLSSHQASSGAPKVGDLLMVLLLLGFHLF